MNRHFGSVSEAVRAVFGEDTTVTNKRRVFGGDINRAYALILSDGSRAFLKCNSALNKAFFETEAGGLKYLKNAGAVGVPEVYAVGTDIGGNLSFILMEYLEGGSRIPGFFETYARELALLHRADTSGLTGSDISLKYGLKEDNFIGASPQKNTPSARWIDFFRDSRLTPQFERARGNMDPAMRKGAERLIGRLDRYLTEPEFPSLIHGDLWSGNFVTGPDGKAWIIDPAAYVGFYEAELAMTELFGANPREFYDAYSEINPIDSGYRDRKEIYNLYHILNHFNLFGGSYLSAARHIIMRYA